MNISSSSQNGSDRYPMHFPKENIYQNSNDYKEKKELKKMIISLQDQINIVHEKTKTIEKDKKLKNQIEILLTNSKEKLEQCDLLITIEKKENRNKSLEELGNFCDHHLKIIQNSSYNIHENKSFFENFSKDHDQYVELFNKAFEKIRNKKIKIEEKTSSKHCDKVLSDIIERLEDLAPKEMISQTLKNSYLKDNYRIQKNNEFKKLCLSSLIKFQNLVDAIDMASFNFSRKRIESLQNTLNNQKFILKEYLEQQKTVDILTLAQTFESKYKNPDYSYKSDLLTLSSNQEKIDLLSKQIDHSLRKLSCKKQNLKNDLDFIINKINKQIIDNNERFKGILDLFDNDPALLSQRKNANLSLQIISEEIISKWNAFCLDFYELDYAFCQDFFELYKDKPKNDSIFLLNKKMGWIFTLAESIQGNLYNIRTKQDSRKLSKIVFESQRKFYNLLCDVCNFTNQEIANFKNLPFDENEKTYNFIKIKMAEISSLSPHEDSQKTLKDHILEAIRSIDESIEFLKKDSNLFDLSEKIGFLSAEGKELLEQKRQHWIEQRNLKKSDLIKAFNLLTYMCSLASSEINLTSEALNNTLMFSDFDEKFIQAYNEDSILTSKILRNDLKNVFNEEFPRVESPLKSNDNFFLNSNALLVKFL